MERIWLARYPQGTPAEISLAAGTTLVDLFRRSCERFAARPAFHNWGTTLSYAEVDAPITANIDGVEVPLVRMEKRLVP